MPGQLFDQEIMRQPVAIVAKAPRVEGYAPRPFTKFAQCLAGLGCKGRSQLVVVSRVEVGNVVRGSEGSL